MKKCLLWFVCQYAVISLQNCYPQDASKEQENDSAKSIPYELIESCANNDIAAVKQRIAAGDNVNHHSRQFPNPLFRAIKEGNKEIVVLLLNSGVDPNIKSFLNEGDTPLHLLATGFLVDSFCDGAENPETLDVPTRRVLRVMATVELSLIEELKRHGANLRAKSKKGETPLQVAKRGKRIRLFEVLAPRKSKENGKSNGTHLNGKSNGTQLNSGKSKGGK